MRLTHALLLATLCATPTLAQDAPPPPSLALELNALTPSETGCRVTFLATNTLGTELTRSAFEIALFGAGGGIERLVSLDFKAMPEGKTRVLQFDIGELGCDKVSRVLINDVVACEGTGLDPKVCLAGLSTVSRLDGVEFGI
ncbi:hypothetical protein VW23_023040 [Devosia insulae DS-56]|uniref:Tat pathway signal sequence domain protein n=1 Tax=Devosia insulae DS-56 TaxID=1116389 RepID=A0A1E5XNB8_9HYPH|nr:hypothetical protein [Devosia insulae]OEO30088.1 hypothetical protein VW23_023040 [Devosia insulae DS-56]